MTAPMQAGPCDSWIGIDEFASYQPDSAGMSGDLLIASLEAATDLLFSLTGRQFFGECEATVRPMSRPRGYGLQSWRGYYSSLTGSNWSASWGSCHGGEHDLCPSLPKVDLGLYPLNQIVEVRVDGVVLSPSEYAILDDRWLVKQASTAVSQPSDGRYGWPVCQDLRLPATQPGTFEVTAIWGYQAPANGKLACAALAVEMARAAVTKEAGGGNSKLPNTVTSISRQGVSTSFASVTDSVKAGLTGVTLADNFIGSVNSHKQRRPPLVWSPDLDQVAHF